MEAPILTKKIKQRLRELAGIAHERALRKAMQPIENALADMSAGKIDAFEASDIIHQFHQKTAREIWIIYQRADLQSAIQSGLLEGVITPEELPSETRQWFVQRVEDIKCHWESLPDEETDLPQG